MRKQIFILFFVFVFVFACMPLISHARENVVNFELTILGLPTATKEQCLQHLLRHSPHPKLTVSPKELVEYYYKEATHEGVRPDVAFAQALLETGYFRYGGDVYPYQNNFCGLGSVGGGARGASFPTAQIGVRAHIQHLLVYATIEPPSLPVVNPRYEIVKRGKNFGASPTWTSLNGKWAVPGTTYGQKILNIHQRILNEK
jgi:hypothetical protein